MSIYIHIQMAGLIISDVLRAEEGIGHRVFVKRPCFFGISDCGIGLVGV